MTPIERLHEDYRKDIEKRKKEKDMDEYIRIHTTGGSAET